ncbi:MAG: radical SAM protein [Candidatus Stahlbacteria bacterium]|nr:radical SAM protein [Candidatus Stahlbacteria bacterium]
MTKYPLYDSTCIFLEITGCPNKCRHCYISKSASKFKTFKEIKDIIDNYAEVLKPPVLTKNAYLYFHDEATVHPDIIDILEYMVSKGIKCIPSLSTNGFGICKRKDGEKVLDAFKKVGTKSLQLTLFGDRDYHDWFAGRKGAFDTIMETYKIGKGMEYNIYWQFFLTKDNWKKLLKTKECLKNEQIDIGIFGCSERLLTDKEYLQPTLKDLEKVKKLAENLSDSYWQKIPHLTIKTEREWIEMCLANKDMAPFVSNEEEDAKNPWFMEYDRWLYDTVMMRSDFRIGNLRVDNLRDIFSQKRYSKESIKWEELSYSLMAQQVGDIDSNKIYWFNDLLFRWFLKLYPNPEYEVTYSNYRIKVENKISYRYFPSFKETLIKNHLTKKLHLLKYPWSKVFNLFALKDNSFLDILNKLVHLYPKTPQEKIREDLTKFLNSLENMRIVYKVFQKK